MPEKIRNNTYIVYSLLWNNIVVPLSYLIVLFGINLGGDISSKFINLGLFFYGLLLILFITYYNSLAIGVLQLEHKHNTSDNVVRNFSFGKSVWWFNFIFPFLRFNGFGQSLSLYKIKEGGKQVYCFSTLNDINFSALYFRIKIFGLTFYFYKNKM